MLAPAASTSSSSSSPRLPPPSQSTAAIRTPPDVRDSISAYYRRSITTDHRAMLFRLPVGDNVVVLIDSHRVRPHVLRNIRTSLEGLSDFEKSISAGGGIAIVNCLRDLGMMIDIYLEAPRVDEPGTLTIPLGLAGVFRGTYGHIDTTWAMLDRAGSPRWAGEKFRTIAAASNCTSTAASYFMRSLQCTSSAIHAFIRDKRESCVTISYQEKPGTDLSTIDILAAIDPKRAFDVMNAMFEVMSYTCIDESQDPGFSSRMIPAGETFNTPRAIYGRGIHALALQAVAGASNTFVGHACFLFIVLTQLDEIEYGQYCRRMGLPDDLVVPRRRYSFLATDPCLVGGTMMVPAGATSSPSSITQYLLAPLTPERLGERKRSFDDSHPESSSPPLAPRTSRYGAPKPRKGSAHWDKVARTKHAELMLVVERAEAELAIAKDTISSVRPKRRCLSVVATGKRPMVYDERLPPIDFKDKSTAYDAPPAKRHRGDASIPSTPADRDTPPDLKCHETIDDLVIDDDATPIDPDAGHASDYPESSETSDDDEPHYSIVDDYDSL